ncbi:MAG: DEAD/DEAH box helicase, partial [Gammaproteobacteria bacterium]
MSMTTFAELNLDPQIAKALEACGYVNPTPIQAKSIPEILAGRDVVASAQTGTGKTAAFVLPSLHRICTTTAGPSPRILILTPTRELATQITTAVSKYGKFLRVNIASLVGGMPYRQQLRSLSRPVDIIVATPGRLLDHMNNGRLDLSAVEMLILDEADRMLDMGFIDDVKEISREISDNRQTLLFSATVDSKLTQIIRQLLKDPVKIDFSHEKLTPAQITQELYHADSPQHKMQLLMHFVTEQNIFKAIIFSATKVMADRLADELIDKGFAAAPLHGDLKQNLRTRTVEELRRGKIQFLVATDVAARGIDINDITHVINYDLPKFSEDYVHRIGRTGRAGKSGIAISLAMPSDARHVANIERFMSQQFERKTIPGLEPKKRSHSDRGHNDNSNHKRRKFSDSNESGRRSFGGDTGKSRFKRKDGDDAGRRSFSDNAGASRFKRKDGADTGRRSFSDDAGSSRFKRKEGADTGRRSFSDDAGSSRFKRKEGTDAGRRSFSDDAGS